MSTESWYSILFLKHFKKSQLFDPSWIQIKLYIQTSNVYSCWFPACLQSSYASILLFDCFVSVYSLFFWLFLFLFICFCPKWISYLYWRCRTDSWLMDFNFMQVTRLDVLSHSIYCSWILFSRFVNLSFLCDDSPNR